jgi:hypothetical protein
VFAKATSVSSSSNVVTGSSAVPASAAKWVSSARASNSSRDSPNFAPWESVQSPGTSLAIGVTSVSGPPAVWLSPSAVPNGSGPG